MVASRAFALGQLALSGDRRGCCGVARYPPSSRKTRGLTQAGAPEKGRRKARVNAAPRAETLQRWRGRGQDARRLCSRVVQFFVAEVALAVPGAESRARSSSPDEERGRGRAPRPGSAPQKRGPRSKGHWSPDRSGTSRDRQSRSAAARAWRGCPSDGRRLGSPRGRTFTGRSHARPRSPRRSSLQRKQGEAPEGRQGRQRFGASRGERPNKPYANLGHPPKRAGRCETPCPSASFSQGRKPRGEGAERKLRREAESGRDAGARSRRQ